MTGAGFSRQAQGSSARPGVGLEAVGLLILIAGLFAFQIASVIASPQQPPELPDGPGKTILVAACTSCHELTEVTKFRGYYTRDEWRDIVVTMVKYGAEVKEKDTPVLVDYLFQTLGKKN